MSINSENPLSFNDSLTEAQDSLTSYQLDSQIANLEEVQPQLETTSVLPLNNENSESSTNPQSLRTLNNNVLGLSNSTFTMATVDTTPLLRTKASGELELVTNAVNQINQINALGNLYAGQTGPSGRPLQALINQLLPLLTTTNSRAPVYLDNVPQLNSGTIIPQTNQSGSLIRIDQFRADPRFVGINGNGFSTVVLDSGINRNHPFFGPDANGDGVSDRIVYQYDFANGDSNAQDFDGHGSNVTSIVASQDSVYRGMAPNANIIAFKVFTDAGGGNFSYIEQALQWIVANAATYNIASINMSLGDSGNYNTNQTLYGISDELAALAALNVTVVSASGNSFFQFGGAQGNSYPAADPNSLSVGAVWDGNNGGPFNWGSGATDFTTGADRLTSFSQRSSTQTDIFAPGAQITGAAATGTGTLTQAGTSQASPHISGIAVLAQQLAVQTLGRRLTQAEFVNVLRTSGVTINDGDDENDNVTNTGLNFKRVDMPGLGNAILAMSNPSGILEFSTGSFSVTENGTVVQAITINRIGGNTNAVSVQVQLRSSAGTATSGTDYTNTFPITVNFAAGETSKTVSIPILQDTVIEPDETINIQLGTPTGGATLGTQTTATYTILDDDTPIFSNSNPITINDFSSATPYPSTINVSGLTGTISKVTVTLSNISHTWPNDIDILLVGPTGVKTLLMSDVGGSNDLNGVTLTLDSTSATALPDEEQIVSGTYQPTDFETDDLFATPAPAGPYSASLGLFNNTNPNGAWQLFVTDDAGGDLGTIANGWQLNILTNAPTLPTITLAISPSSVLENGTTNLVYTFTRNGATTNALTVNFGVSGTATLNTDYTQTGAATYTANTGSVTFAAGATTATVTVDPTGDTTVEANETVALTLSSNANYTIGTTGAVTGTITNDDIASLPTLSINDITVTEGNSGTSNATFTVTLSAASTSNVTVNYGTANGTATSGSDFTNTSGTLTFTPGQTSQTITVPVIGDTVVEPNETFLVNLTTPTNATLADAQGVGTITNDDTAVLPTITLAVAPSSVLENDTNNLVYTFSRTGATSSSLTVNFAVSGTATLGTDYTQTGAATYTSTTGSVTFAAGALTATVAVDPTGDTTVEANETVALTLSSNANYAIGTTGAVTGTITNDDTSGTLPTLRINDVSITEGNSGTTNATFTVTLSAASASNVTVNYGTANGTATSGSDFTNTSGTLTFSPGQTTRTFTVPIIGNTTVEPNETFLVNLTTPTNATLFDGQGVGTIIDNDSVIPTFQFSLPSYTSTEGGSTTTVTITRAGTLTNPSTVQFSIANGTAVATQDFNNTLTTVNFIAGQSSRTVSIIPINDTIVENSEFAFLRLANPTNGTLGSQDIALWNIVDNDVSNAVTATAIFAGGNSNEPLTGTSQANRFVDQSLEDENVASDLIDWRELFNGSSYSSPTPFSDYQTLATLENILSTQLSENTLIA